MHMGIPVYKRAGIAKKFAYGDPITQIEIVRVRGLTYVPPAHAQRVYLEEATGYPAQQLTLTN